MMKQQPADQKEPAVGTNQRSQVAMTDDEIVAFIASQRTASLVTIGASGHPHAVAMWFALIDGVIWFETKAKSQKAVNLRRDARATVLVEDGLTYDSLRGVSLEGRAEIVDDAEALWAVGVSVWERYNGPYTDELKPFVELMLNKRVAVRFDVKRTRSWDHRKLGLDPLPLGGTTAPATDTEGPTDNSRPKSAMARLLIWAALAVIVMGLTAFFAFQENGWAVGGGGIAMLVVAQRLRAASKGMIDEGRPREVS